MAGEAKRGWCRKVGEREACAMRVMIRVRKMYFDQDETARWAGEGGERS